MDGNYGRDLLKSRRYFNPYNKDDMKAVKKFFTKNRWDGCPFILEWPYLTIPDMIKSKLTMALLK